MWKLFEPVDSPHQGSFYGCLCAIGHSEVNHYEIPPSINVAKATDAPACNKTLISLVGCLGYSKHSH
jgi:hypothetical protein